MHYEGQYYIMNEQYECIRNQSPELHNALHYVILTSFGTQIPILKADHFIAITLSMYTVI